MGTDTSRAAALLMAGGSGTRLWPISRRGRAKQFARLLGETTLLEMTYERVRAFLPDARIFVNVTAGNEHWVERLLPTLPTANVIAAPDDRDTLPTIGFATLSIEQLVPAPTILLLASDNWIGDVAPLQDALWEAIDAAERGPHLVSIGIRPRSPSTQYGYMHVGERAPFGAASYFGLGYQEKPTADVARRFLAGGAHDWNSGMFAWTAETFWGALRAFAPEDADVFDELRERRHAMSQDERRAAFGRLRKLAVDHGILEHVGAGTAEKHVFVRAAVAWDDVGHYEALAPYLREDASGNRVRGDVTASETRACTLLCDSGSALVVRGVGDLLVVSDSGDVLVARRASHGRVRELAELDLWAGAEHASAGANATAAGQAPATPEGGHRLRGFVKVLGARDCAVDNRTEGVVALVDVAGLTVRVAPGRVEVSRAGPASESEQAQAAPSLALPRGTALTVAEDEERMSALAAAYVVERLQARLAEERSPLVIFSAGRTPLVMFRLLRSIHRTSIDWSRVRVAQMDELAGAPYGQSLARALEAELFGHLGVQRFGAIDPSWSRAELLAYEVALSRERIDLVVHGIGCNGHLGFNEPGASFDGSADIVDLTPLTRERLSWSCGSDAVPERGLTLGLRTLHAARDVVLLASSSAKSSALRAALFGPVNCAVPASMLQLHPQVAVYVDRHAAASWLLDGPRS